MRIKSIKYLSPLIIYLGAWHSFQVAGWQVWMPLVYAWVIIPLLELFIRPSSRNMSAAEEELAKNDPVYDLLLYVIVIAQYLLLFRFLDSFSQPHLKWYDITGRIWVMGLLCGIFGINAGHELGHRVNKAEQLLAKILLLTSQYMHFIIEHNKGHHKRVATPQDPSSARYGEWIYIFYFRSAAKCMDHCRQGCPKKRKAFYLPI